MTNIDKIKAKIKALLAKTVESGATKFEMESALAKANQLMTDYFISEYDLKDTEIINKCVSESFKLTKSGFDLSLFYYDLKMLFDCESHYNNETITFFGYEQDVALCGYFYSLITRTCLHEKNEYLKSEKYIKLKQYNHGKTLSKSFIKGFLVEVSSKMKAMYQERERNIPATYGLMVIKKKEKIKSEYEELNLKIKNKKSNFDNIELEAFQLGIEKGKEINLIQGIDSNNVVAELQENN